MSTLGRTRPRATRLALVDDDALLAEGLPLALGRYSDLDTVVVTPDWREVVPLARFVDVVLLDVHLDDGCSLRHKVQKLGALDCRVLVLGDRDVTRIQDVLESGARGYAHKQDGLDNLVAAVREISNGGLYLERARHSARLDTHWQPKLSIQETRALTLYSSGFTMAQVATSMAVTTHTATSYIRRVRDKYAAVGREARSKVQLMQRATEDGLMPAGRLARSHDHGLVA